MKRISDLVIASALIALTLPLMGAVALMIKLDSAGPVLTREERRTNSGRRLTVLKFRTTMQPRERPPQFGRSTGSGQERPTQIGRFLRYSRIVDLPQLCNVLRGEISLVDAGAERPDFFD